MKTYEIIGKNLKTIRLQRKLLQVDIAVATGINSKYISKIESGKARITLPILYKLVKGLKIKSKDLLLENNFHEV